MKTIIVNKDLLNNYKFISIGLENCDVYKISVEDIIDVNCVAELIDPKKNEYYTKDGFIKISKKASETIECSVLRNNELNKEWDIRLKDRLELCDGAVDMPCFSLEGEDNKIEVFVPYDPLEDVLHGSEIELSNCPSLHIDGEGNMLIAFGESSTQPRRKDNNFAELVDGWVDAFDGKEPSVLHVKVDMLSTFGNDSENLSLSFKILDKFCKKNYAKLVFLSCQKIRIETVFPEDGDCQITMSKMADGSIYVGCDGLGIDFTCTTVLEYNYYCNKLKD